MPRGTKRRARPTSTTTSSTSTTRPEPAKKPVDLHIHLHGCSESGSPGWIRTTECLSQSQTPAVCRSSACGASIYTKRDFRSKPIKGLRIHLHGNRPAYRHSLSPEPRGIVMFRFLHIG